MNNNHRKPLQGTQLEYFDVREAVEQIQPGAYAKLPYTSKVLAEQLVRRCDPAILEQSLKELIFSKQDHDFPWYPARVVCHDILGQTALVDLAGLRDAIADQGGDPSKVNPVVPTQLIVDHSLAVEYGGFDPDAFEKNRVIEDRRNEDRFHHCSMVLRGAIGLVGYITPQMIQITNMTWLMAKVWLAKTGHLQDGLPSNSN